LEEVEAAFPTDGVTGLCEATWICTSLVAMADASLEESRACELVEEAAWVDLVICLFSLGETSAFHVEEVMEV
jgi:hypothetical protein